MPRSNSSSYRRHRRRSSSSPSSSPHRKRSSDSYHSRNKHKSGKRSNNDKSKRRSQRSTSSSSSSSSSPSPHNSRSPIKQESINLNLLEDKINTKTLDELEKDIFQPKTFSSSTNTKSTVNQKVTIDLENETVIIPSPLQPDPIDDEDSIIHPQFLDNNMEKWIKKLYNYRQKMVNE